METIGYICATKTGLDTEQQAKMLSEHQLTRVYTDILKDEESERPAFEEMCRQLQPQDVVMVATVGVLGQDYDEILSRWTDLVQHKLVHVVVQDMPLLDTRLTTAAVQGISLPDLILQVLAYAKRMDRTEAKQRQAEGISAAKERGVRFGRPPQKRPAQFLALKKQFENREISARAAAKELNITHRTFLKWVESANEA